MGAKINRGPACHPTRKYWAKDLCASCYRKQWTKNYNPTYQRNYDLKRFYGLTIREYDQLLERQGGVCAICKRHPSNRRLSVDHHHKTKVVRGLLCWKCNYRLVPYYVTPELLRSAADYLEGKSTNAS